MTKHEFPPFNMIIEGNRLVPATAYDQERLDSFRRGTKVQVRFTEEKDRVLVRKWWAILSLVVKQCDVPWKTKEEASEAVKLALGIVNLTKTIKHDYLAYPKSLTELEDPELREAVDQMTELLSRLTGVDVETLKKETAHIVPEIEENVDAETGEITPNTNPGDAVPSASAGTDESGMKAASSAEQDQSSPSSDDHGSNTEPADNPEAPTAAAGSASLISESELFILRRFAKDALTTANTLPSEDGMKKVLNRWWNGELASVKSEKGIAAIKSIRLSVAAIMRNDGEVTFDVVVGEHANGLGCTVEELGGAS